jgi:hypothetical protein
MPNHDEEIGDPSVPADLLELHVELEQKNMTPKQFKEVFSNEADH